MAGQHYPVLGWGEPSKELTGDVTVFSLKGNSVNTIVHRTVELTDMLTPVTLSQKSISVQHCGNVAQVHDKCVQKDF
jgi:hypothetical protein